MVSEPYTLLASGSRAVALTVSAPGGDRGTTMRVDFPYPGYEQIEPFDVPDENLMGVYAPATYDRVDERRVLAHGFALATGAPRLRDAVRDANRVLILIDDGTRATPTARI